MSTAFAQIAEDALKLPAEERARLADALWNSLSGQPTRQVVMTAELESLLDEGRENYERACTTIELRRQRCRQQ